MLQLVWGLFVLLLLAGACAVLASGGKIHAALLPLPLLAGSAVLLYGFGIVGALRAGVALVILLLAAVWVVGLVKLRPAGFAKACREALSTPGLVLFLGGAAFSGCCFLCSSPCLPSGMSSPPGVLPPRWWWSAGRSMWRTPST